MVLEQAKSQIAQKRLDPCGLQGSGFRPKLGAKEQ
jgi:hypothetical protein